MNGVVRPEERGRSQAVSGQRSAPATERNGITTVSFFCGCGGLDLGMSGGFRVHKVRYRRLPFSVVAAYDSDPLCIQTYCRNFPGVPAHIVDLASAPVEGMPSAEVLIGGFPCQDFSSCGPRRGLMSDRGRLYEAMARYMKCHQPKVVVAENVANLGRIEKGETLATILQDLSLGGLYRFDVWRLNAADYGVPQKRSRIFLVGVLSSLEGGPKKPRPHYRGNPRSIEWAIGDLIDVTDESVANQSQYFRAGRALNGNGQGDETSRKGEPAYTVRANAKSRVQFHYSLKRRLTVRECARIQTFPDDFEFPHAATTNIKQIGNAVPPLLGYQVAREVARFLGSGQLKEVHREPTES